MNITDLSAPEPYRYVAAWTRKRSTRRLLSDFAAALRAQCECDSYVGFHCPVHRRREELRFALVARRERMESKS